MLPHYLPEGRWFDLLGLSLRLAHSRAVHLSLLAAAAVTCPLATLYVSANGVEPVTRKQMLCERLGYEGVCVIQFVEGASSWGLLELTVASDVSEPDQEPAIPGIHATAVRLELNRHVYTQIYQRSASVYSVLYDLMAPPCVFAECVERRQEDQSYHGLTEADLLDVANVLEHALWQTADAKMLSRMQEDVGLDALPVITAVREVRDGLDDETGSELPSSLRFRVRVEWALKAQA